MKRKNQSTRPSLPEMKETKKRKTKRKGKNDENGRRENETKKPEAAPTNKTKQASSLRVEASGHCHNQQCLQSWCTMHNTVFWPHGLYVS